MPKYPKIRCQVLVDGEQCEHDAIDVIDLLGKDLWICQRHLEIPTNNPN